MFLKEFQPLTHYASVAQPVARVLGKDEVRGSNPRRGSIIPVGALVGLWDGFFVFLPVLRQYTFVG
jgi:hypothetical protein